MKRTIKLDLPDRDQLTAGLTPRGVHLPLVRAEEAVAKLEQSLADRRRELADREQTVADLPARITRGEVAARALPEALRERDAAALLVAPAESSLVAARERVVAEEQRAQAAVTREFSARAEQLERAAADLGLGLAEISELAAALAAARGAGAILSSVDWQCSPRCSASSRTLLSGIVAP